MKIKVLEISNQTEIFRSHIKIVRYQYTIRQSRVKIFKEDQPNKMSKERINYLLNGMLRLMRYDPETPIPAIMEPAQKHLTRMECLTMQSLIKMRCSGRFIARYMNISVGIAKKFILEFYLNGRIKPKEEYMLVPKFYIYTRSEADYIKETIAKLLKTNCSITVGTIQMALSKLGIQIGKHYVASFLQLMQYTRKKLRVVEKERNAQANLLLRHKYCLMISQIPLENLVFIDQTHFESKTMQQYGWSQVRTTPIAHVPTHKNNKKRVTLIAAISVRGFEAVKIVKGKYKPRYFLEFIEHYLDHLCPNEILVMDNAAYHHSHLVKQKMQQLDRPVRFLPAYSPQLNPIQRVFGSIKRRYKKWRRFQTLEYDEMVDLVEKSIIDVNQKNFKEYFDEYQQWVKKGIDGEFFV